MTETSTSTPTETARLPDEEVSGTEPIAEKRYAADPRPWHTIALSDHNGGPSMELRRSFQFKQMQIAFEGEQPDESHLARLKGAGWTDRTESEGVWTKQVHPGEWKGVHDAERLFVEIANDIRAERGLEAITPLGRAAGA